MSPYDGESPISLFFALAPAILGALIGIYLIVRVVQEVRLKASVNEGRPDPDVFSDYPELQAIVDQYYLHRFQARQQMRAQELTAKQVDLNQYTIDEEIERGLIAARELRDAGEADEIAAARAKIANVTAKLEAWGRGEGFKKD